MRFRKYSLVAAIAAAGLMSGLAGCSEQEKAEKAPAQKEGMSGQEGMSGMSGQEGMGGMSGQEGMGGMSGQQPTQPNTPQ
jgi:hypothetical protein